MEMIQLNGGNLPQTMDTGSLGVVAREQTEIQSQIIVAKKFARKEEDCFRRVMCSMTRPAMAEAATYQFPRGDTTIQGPSVDLAREIARCWGNLRYGLRLVEVRKDEAQGCDVVKIRGYAHDMETNTYVEAEDEFRALIQRKDKASGQTRWVAPDERDFRELVNRRGAICVRNALLQVLPPDVVDEALRLGAETLKKAAAGELEQNHADAVRRLTVAYDRLGVTVTMLEQRLGHDLAVVNADELAELRQIWKALSDGQARRDEFFELAPAAATPGTSLAEKLLEKARAVTESAAKAEEKKPKAKPKEKPVPVEAPAPYIMPEETPKVLAKEEPKPDPLAEVGGYTITSQGTPYTGHKLEDIVRVNGSGVLVTIMRETQVFGETDRYMAERAAKALGAAHRE